ncbi:MAG: MgtC/SapB family protein [Elusimicrobiota bacterium]|jgi:putative Mg2+ transporter-C (MgtC) family protein|nr:MgtC/SapB family protein [Elusimicrobiota bacterium]
MITIDEVLIRLLLSVVLGGMIGLERRYHDKPAGFMTNTLICIGSAVFTIMSLHSAFLFGADPSRIAAQVVAGVGFLGAGSILRDGNKISGLTTAASIWVVAAVGMAAGFGNFTLAAAATASVLILQFILRKVMNKFDYIRLYETVVIKCEANWEVVDKIHQIISQNKAEILKEEISKDEGLFVIKMVVNMSETICKSTFRALLAMKEIKLLDK